MKSARLRVRPLVVALASVVGVTAVTACFDDEESPGGGGADAAAAPVEPDGAASSTVDGATADADDASPESDGGPSQSEGGSDAGQVCRSLTAGDYVTSTCGNRFIDLFGGALRSGRFTLDDVRVIGAVGECGDAGTFVPYQHRGRLDITATSETAATFEFLDESRKFGSISAPVSNRYDVTVTASGAELTYGTLACAIDAPPTKVPFAFDTSGAKAILILALPYGANGTARYTFIEE